MRSNKAFRVIVQILSAILASSMLLSMMPDAALAAPVASAGTLQFLCRDSAGYAVPGVGLALFCDEALAGKAGEGTADGSGIVRITGLAQATYWVTVASVPAGFEKPDVRIPVEAADGRVMEYTLVFQKSGVASGSGDGDASLCGLTASSGTISPAFSAETIAYTLTLQNTQCWVKVTPKLAGPRASLTITVDGRRAGRTLTLQAGTEKTMVIRIRAEAGNTKTYTVKIRRAISHSADLAALGVNAGTMQPAFSKGVYAYSVALPAGRSRVTLSIKKGDVYQRYWVYVIGRPSGNTISLNKGETKTVKVTVKAQAGETKTYALTITRGK